jgi:hypothetical protein
LISNATRAIVVPLRQVEGLTGTSVARQDSMANELRAWLTVVESTLQNVERRTKRIEQFLPALVTKEELREAAARLATKEELREAAARLATKEELREEGERTRRHFDVVAERMRDEIRLVAEGHLATEAKFDRQRLEHLALERRVTTLEIAELARRPPQQRDGGET